MTAQETAIPASGMTAWASYRRMQVRLTERLNRELSEVAGLSQADLEVLTVLSENPDDSVRDISLRCGLEWEKSRLSHQLRRMEARGLVARGACFEDNRSSTVALTDVGREAAARGREVEATVIARHLGTALSAEQLDRLGTMAEAVLATLETPHRP
ncbi:MarR family winged helix-turn-helix transcriptional regulator [Mycetocola sp.]|uniref:MarR family winged helix-turn-helix transcriptional regulator n=1 Tax=Mycetocola sp. TaxID=1871042 RepID=UPI00398A1B4A